MIHHVDLRYPAQNFSLISQKDIIWGFVKVIPDWPKKGRKSQETLSLTCIRSLRSGDNHQSQRARSSNLSMLPNRIIDSENTGTITFRDFIHTLTE